MKRIQSQNPALLSRIIPQAYFQGDLEYIRSLYDFDDVFFSLYQHEGINDMAVLRFAKKYMVSAVVVSHDRYSSK